MRTRIYDALTNAEITAYLDRNDIIFLPLGVAEIYTGMPARMPVASEHVLPMAFAVRMAELVDGLVLPGLHYFYPGSTAVGKGAINVSPSAGIAYLKEVCRSLLRQGFRRQILLSLHSPATYTASPLVREFFDETKCPILYIDLEECLGEHQSAEELNQIFWGAFHLLGRLDDIPREFSTAEETDLSGPSWRWYRKGFTFGYYLSDDRDFGGWAGHPTTEPERQARAQQGIALIDEIVQNLDMPSVVAGMREIDEHTQRVILPKYGARLP